jgi:hypothetical protein
MMVKHCYEYVFDHAQKTNAANKTEVATATIYPPALKQDSQVLSVCQAHTAALDPASQVVELLNVLALQSLAAQVPIVVELVALVRVKVQKFPPLVASVQVA